MSLRQVRDGYPGRRAEVMRLAGLGRSAEQIAEAMGISVRAAKHYLADSRLQSGRSLDSDGLDRRSESEAGALLVRPLTPEERIQYGLDPAPAEVSKEPLGVGGQARAQTAVGMSFSSKVREVEAVNRVASEGVRPDAGLSLTTEERGVLGPLQMDFRARARRRGLGPLFGSAFAKVLMQDGQGLTPEEIAALRRLEVDFTEIARAQGLGKKFRGVWDRVRNLRLSLKEDDEDE